MQLDLGRKIRELRRRDNRTQEALAEAVGVTPQAISRWESGGGYPDMESIPAIANYFGITIDELFGYENDRERKIDALLARSEEAHRVDWGEERGIDECLAILRGGLVEFPGNERILLRLAVVLRDAGYVRDGHFSRWDEDGFFVPDVERHRKNAYWQEAIRILEKLSSAPSGSLLAEARQELLLLYDNMGEYEKARALADTFPAVHLSRSAAMCFACGGEKRAEAAETYLLKLFDELVNRMVSAAQLCRTNFEDHTALDAVENAIRLSRVFFAGGSYGRFHGTLVTLYLYLSSLRWRAGRKDEAFEALDLALGHARAFQALADTPGAHYDTPLLRHVPIRTDDIGRDPLTLAEDWPWWAVPNVSDIADEFKADPRFAEWVERTREQPHADGDPARAEKGASGADAFA
ncbi:MAG: helix-turn-helix transcriptional regulator [Clostridia bacterium]|nr:helix-turn-helix transcriptional regulator [Clostridia bacterium]